MFTKLKALLIILLSLVVLSACKITKEPTKPDILTILSASEQHTIFVSLVEKTNSTEILSKNEGLTVLAPTNDFFENLPTTTWRNLQEVDAGLLERIVLNHIIESDLPIAAIEEAFADCDVDFRVGTMAKDGLRYGQLRGRLSVGYSYILQGDIIASNGRIHFVDSLLIPYGSPDWLKSIHDRLWEIREVYSKMTDAYSTVAGPSWPCYNPPDWLWALSHVGSYIVLIPTDIAFDTLEGVDTSSKDDIDVLTELVHYHIFEEVAQDSATNKVTWLNHRNFRLEFINDDTIQVNGKPAKIVREYSALNGTIYVINSVLAPPELEPLIRVKE